MKDLKQRFTKIIEKFNTVAIKNRSGYELITPYEKTKSLFENLNGSPLRQEDVIDRIRTAFETLNKWNEELQKDFILAVEFAENNIGNNSLILNVELRGNNGENNNILFSYFFTLIDENKFTTGATTYTNAQGAFEEFTFKSDLTSKLIIEEIINTIEEYEKTIVVEEVK